MIPLRDNIPTRRRPVVTLALIAINVLVFLFELTAPAQHLTTTNQRVYLVQGQTAIQYEYGFV
ncbi:MAG: hypothetical protein QOE17_2071, partial [Gaiellales bacterium]|nr:hypothetical protein [Gaiellales bacterium]